ncbi:MAG: preprotein translocase subunit SecG [Clostridia bacterium]|nr:preprotein translocase subunit SecG [Clostridia bacterium]
MKTVLTILQVIVSLGLIASVILQSGRSAGISGAIAGGAETFFGKKKGMDRLLHKITIALAIAFLILTLLLSMI